jgi:hypothetical protein
MSDERHDGPPTGQPSGAPDFQAFVNAFLEALTSGDQDRIGSFIARDGKLIYVAEEFADPMIGWDAVMAYWAANSRLMTRVAMRSGEVRVSELGPGVFGLLYPLHWEAEISGQCLGGDVLASPVVRLIDGDWRIVHYTECALGALPFIRSIYKKAVSPGFLAAARGR